MQLRIVVLTIAKINSDFAMDKWDIYWEVYLT